MNWSPRLVSDTNNWMYYSHIDVFKQATVSGFIPGKAPALSLVQFCIIIQRDMATRLLELRQRLDREEREKLSPRASFSDNARRRRPDETADRDHRQSFAVDTDRILHSLAFTRYIDKTQVFYLIKNDHITHRVLHVQLVSRIARTIGRHLGLNEDLIEAISLGHDLGHAPFGHDGEAYLSRLCVAHDIGHFVHAAASVEFLERIERKGQGLNLTLQVLDGIFTHNGELDQAALVLDPELTFEEFDRRLQAKLADPTLDFMPMTHEGCVVRLADTISYIGRDIEDAIRLNLVQRSDLPVECTGVIGGNERDDRLHFGDRPYSDQSGRGFHRIQPAGRPGSDSA